MDTTSLHRLLAAGGWERYFDPGAYGRALGYVRQQRVLDLAHEALDAHNDGLIGAVRGTASEPYACAVQIRSERGGLHADSRCTCPVGAWCKHLAAMLIVASRFPPSAWPQANHPASERTASTRLDARKQIPSGRTPAVARSAIEPWERWLHALDGASTLPSREAEPHRRFGLLLRAEHGDRSRLLANPVWLQSGKTTALTGPQPLQLDDAGPFPTPVGGWSAEDAGALALLLQHRGIRHGGQLWTPIRAIYLEQALQSLLAQHPVYFEKASNGALAPGEPLDLRLAWEGLPDGGQRLTVETVADTLTLLLRGAGLWYVQPQARRLGRVHGDPRLLDAVPRAPTLQPEQVPALQQRLHKRTAGLDLPAPAERGPIRRIEAAPVPVLRMHVLALPFGDLRYGAPLCEVGCARFGFDYDGVFVDPDAVRTSVRMLRDGCVLEIRRNAPLERRAETALQGAGLTDAEPFAIDWDFDIPAESAQQRNLLLQPNRRKPPLAPADWKPALQQLSADGFRIEYAPDFPHDERVDVDAWHADIEASGNTWFDVALGIEVGGERIDLLPILRRVLADPRFTLHAPKREKKDASWRVPLDENRSVELPLARLRALIEPLLEWLESDDERLRLHRSRAAALLDLETRADLSWRGGDALRAQIDTLARAARAADPPAGFAAALRPYQREGLAWLDFLADAGLGGILADDMGLGKTVQVLAHVLAEKSRGRLAEPALVVAPTSLVGNWRDEAARFAPDLRVLVLHGADRIDRYDAIATHDLVITTYPLLPRDRERLIQQRFALLIVDEAQAIKNARSQAARVVREIPAARRLAMTGTPLENHLGERWAQFDAVEPGLLGSERQFARLYRTPIEKRGDADRQQRLNRRIGPLLLRRRKDDVLADLPPKTEIVRMLPLEGAQRELYETLRLAQHRRVHEAVARRGLAQSGIIVLDALLKLRQVCCDPRLVKLDSARKFKGSAKLDALVELLSGLLAEGRRVLLFSQFTEMLALIAQALDAQGIEYLMLTGQTPGGERAGMVRRFQAGTVPLFLISLKAGGVGLNLTAADAVIHYDPWWNPAVEAQATDRAHRIGQDKPVFVYKLICEGTVEERIQALQMRKAELARAVLEGGSSQRLRFDEADLNALFAPL